MREECGASGEAEGDSEKYRNCESGLLPLSQGDRGANGKTADPWSV